MTAIILLVLEASIILSVFAIGLKATFADGTFLFRRPGHLIRALVSMNVLMPLTALAVGAPFDLHPAVKIALVVIAVSPTPPVLPKKALKAGGTEAYPIGLLVAMAALSIVVIPLSMETFERIAGVPLVMPASSVATLVLTTILAPLLAGIAVQTVAHVIRQQRFNRCGGFYGNHHPIVPVSSSQVTHMPAAFSISCRYVRIAVS